MKPEEIKNLAERFAKEKTAWHFHILTPACKLNDKDGYALILENTSNGEIYSCLSSEPFMGIGAELVKLLHGDDVIKTESEKKDEPPSELVKRILERAKELMSKGVFWHHHLLFPDCQFNKNKGRWTLAFEDPEKDEVIESVSAVEPKSDLRHIEALFYSQNK